MLERCLGSSQNKDILRLFKQLSLLTKAGLPLSKSLEIACKDRFDDLLNKINLGNSFSDSMDPKIFDRTIINMISVGERTGDLTKAFIRAHDHLVNRESFKKKIFQSLSYPMFVLLMCFVILFILTTVFIPSISAMFSSFGVKMPLLNRLIVAFSNYLPLIAIVFVAGVYLSARHLMSDKGFNIYVIGGFRKKLIKSQVCKVLSDCLSAGVNMTACLHLALQIITSNLIKSDFEKAVNMVTEGSSVSESLKITGLFNDNDISLISAGEFSSSLDLVFCQLANFYEQDIEDNIRTFTSIIEPAAILFTGVIVGVIVFAMFTPMITLMSELGGS